MRMTLTEIQPSQLYISQTRLSLVQEGLLRGVAPGALPIMRLDGAVVFTDGHTRALLAWRGGEHEVEVAWDTDPVDHDAYRECVRWCQEEGIRAIADLDGRILDDQQFRQRWIERCRRMHEELRRREPS